MDFYKNKTSNRLELAGLVMLFGAILTAAIIVYFIVFIFYTAYPVLVKEGFGFITGNIWNYSTGEYGIFVFIVGTIVLTFVTLILACPLSILTAIYLAEFSPTSLRNIIRPLIELLVGIPSVVYGIFGIFVLEEYFQLYIDPFISSILGFIPIFRDSTPNSGDGIFLASTVLAIMILPTITVLSEEAIRAVAYEHKAASYSLGATKWETIKNIVLPIASPGIITAIILGTMRAMGETMAIVMLMGNAAKIPSSIFDTGYTMTSKIVNEITYYVSMDEPRSALFGIAAVLFLMEISFVGIIRLIGGRKKWS